ncbi:MAG: PilZ domain-containing protein [Elusimicrobiota bacterium]
MTLKHDERRKHKRLPVIKDLAEPIELAIMDNHGKSHRTVPGVVTNLSAGGMDLVLMGVIDGKPNLKLTMHLPGFDRFEVEGRLAWSRPKESTSAIGIEFTKIDSDHSKQLIHMGEAYWECENRIKEKAPTICFHGCSYWDLCEKPAKLKHPKSHVPK